MCLILILSVCIKVCADPEHFARGSPTLTTFFSDNEGERFQIPLKVGHHRPASVTSFKWSLAKRHLNGVSLAGRWWHFYVFTGGGGGVGGGPPAPPSGSTNRKSIM